MIGWQAKDTSDHLMTKVLRETIESVMSVT
jgi:hypothetical protein